MWRLLEQLRLRRRAAADPPEDGPAQDGDPAEAMLPTLERLVRASVKYSSSRPSTVDEFRACRAAVDDAWLELSSRGADEARLSEARVWLANARAEVGNRLFYDRIGADDADIVEEFKAALALDATCVPALRGLLSAYLHGELRPREALPYAVALARLDPAHEKTVSYVESLLAEDAYDG
jgi:hypothetical protein